MVTIEAGTDSDARRRGARAKPVGRGPANADRRQQILAAAATRFAESGFEATTVRQIADSVHILSGSLYHHFATKEEMLHEIVRAAAAELGLRAVRIAALRADAEARLVTLVHADLAALTRDHVVHAILFNERKFFRRNPDFAYVVEALKAAYAAWETILRDGMADGRFDADCDVSLTISTIIRLLNTSAGWFVHEDAAVRGTLGAADFERLAAFHTGFVLRAIRAPGRAGAPVPDALE